MSQSLLSKVKRLPKQVKTISHLLWIFEVAGNDSGLAGGFGAGIKHEKKNSGSASDVSFATVKQE